MPNRILDKAAFILFLIGVFAAGGIYGIFVHRDRIFPYEILHEANLAYHALAAVSRVQTPASFKRYVAKVKDVPNGIIESSGNVDQDWILVTGGPYEFLEQCPRYGCLAWVIDRRGTVVHSWEADLDELWSNVDHVEGRTDPGSFKWLGVQLLEDGSLLVAFHNNRAFPEGAGMGKFDRDGKLVWFNNLNMNHWFTLDPRGTIYSPTHYVVKAPFRIGASRNRIKCREPLAQLDYVAIIGTDGRMRDRIDLIDLLLSNGYIGLIQVAEDSCDPFHLNFVEYIGAEMARSISYAKEGDLLISLRNINTVLIFSPETRIIKWIDTGRYVRQHSPRLLADGSIVLFDNLGGNRELGGSRVIRMKLGAPGLSVVFPRAAEVLGQEFFTAYAGHISVGPDGKTALVSLTSTGEVLEVDLATGEVLWRYQKVFPIEGYPGADPPHNEGLVQVEAFGAYYVNKAAFAPIFKKR